MEKFVAMKIKRFADRHKNTILRMMDDPEYLQCVKNLFENPGLVDLVIKCKRGKTINFISDHLEAGEKPSINQTLDEIQMVCMTPFRTAYELLSSDDFCQGSVEGLLFVTLEHWDRLSDEITQYFRNSESHAVPEAKVRQSIFEDGRFWEYVAQIRIDDYDPADILEDWLKEHNPDHFKDPAELTAETAT